MNKPIYQSIVVDPPVTQNLPPNTDNQLYREPAPSAPTVDYGAPPLMPPKYQPYCGTPGAGVNQGPVLQAPQIVVTSVQPVMENDYMGYSIFTMFCCCLPIGIAALVFSVKTYNANYSGKRMAAQTYSKVARILAHTALSIGIVLNIILVIAYSTNIFSSRKTYQTYNPWLHPYPKGYSP